MTPKTLRDYSKVPPKVVWSGHSCPLPLTLARSRARLGRITVPNLKLSVIGGARFIFTLSMEEIAIRFFLFGRDNSLPLEVWGRLRPGNTLEINAISARPSSWCSRDRQLQRGPD